MVKSQVRIYLVQPIDKSYKEAIVYADTEEQARIAAAALAREAKTPQAIANGNEIASIYVNRGESICIEIEPTIIDGENTNEVSVKYNEVIYKLKKSKAEEVIAENII